MMNPTGNYFHKALTNLQITKFPNYQITKPAAIHQIDAKN